MGVQNGKVFNMGVSLFIGFAVTNVDLVALGGGGGAPLPAG